MHSMMRRRMNHAVRRPTPHLSMQSRNGSRSNASTYVIHVSTGSLGMPSTRPMLAVNVRLQSLQYQRWLPLPVCPLRTILMEPHLTQASAGSSCEPVPNMSSCTMERRASIALRRSSSSSNARPVSDSADQLCCLAPFAHNSTVITL